MYSSYVPDKRITGGLDVVLPVGYTALSGDLEAHVTGGWAGLTGRLQLLERSLYPLSGPILLQDESTLASSPPWNDVLLQQSSVIDAKKFENDSSNKQPDGWYSMGSVPLTWTNTSSLHVRFPCGIITRGGRYGVKLVVDVSNLSYVPLQVRNFQNR